MTPHSVQIQINNMPLTIETGKVAKQADGAVVVRCGGTMVLSTVVASQVRHGGPGLPAPHRGVPREAYAGGRIPGGFFKREGRPDEKETLTCRLIDRPLRPLFPKGFRNEIQIINLVISADTDNDPDVLAMIGSSAAMALSGHPVRGSGRRGAGGAGGRQAGGQSHLQAGGGLPARAGDGGHRGRHPDGRVRRQGDQRGADARGARLRPRALQGADADPEGPRGQGGQAPLGLRRPGGRRSGARGAGEGAGLAPRWSRPCPCTRSRRAPRRLDAIFEEVFAAVGGDEAARAKARGYFEKVEKAEVRRLIVEKGIRVDGRSVKEVRPIWSEVAYLPRAHGSALFTRGETQALVVGHARHQGRRAEDRVVRGQRLPALHAALQLPARSRPAR